MQDHNTFTTGNGGLLAAWETLRHGSWADPATHGSGLLGCSVLDAARAPQEDSISKAF